MLKIAICDDDSKWIERFKKTLLTLARKHSVKIEVISYTNGEALLFDFANLSKQADAIYLDIHMGGIDGLQTARELRKMGSKKEIVFLTYDKEPVFEAFDVKAFHYIVKNVTSDKKIESIFVELIENLENKNQEFISFSFGGKNRDVAISEIRYFQVDVRVITVYFGKSDSFCFYSTMGKLENALCDKGFMRIHRSVIVNTAYIKNATYQEVTMQNGTKLPVGRYYWQELKEVVQWQKK